MRQYNNLRGKLKDDFQYKDMKPTYLIILMESSSTEFKAVSPEYFHEFLYHYSSGAVVSNLSNIIYISLDTFNESVHNIDTERDAWLTFLSATEYSKIIKLLEKHPEFIELYKEIAVFRQDPERLMNMVSEMIRELDHNTIMYMIDEFKLEIEQQKAELKQKNAELEQQKTELEHNKAELEQKDAEIERLRKLLYEKDNH
ncbi:MAG: PD-(D/E)XK nuclease family transposase [Lachnospira sp.]